MRNSAGSRATQPASDFTLDPRDSRLVNSGTFANTGSLFPLPNSVTFEELPRKYSASSLIESERSVSSSLICSSVHE